MFRYDVCKVFAVPAQSLRFAQCRVGAALMSAANVSGIPHSFVVDSAGVVKFQGHPADPNFEKAVAQVCRSRPPP